MQDGTAMLWDLAEGKKLYSLEANETIHALCFSPNRYCALQLTPPSRPASLGVLGKGKGDVTLLPRGCSALLSGAFKWRKFSPEHFG